MDYFQAFKNTSVYYPGPVAPSDNNGARYEMFFLSQYLGKYLGMEQKSRPKISHLENRCTEIIETTSKLNQNKTN